MAVLQASYGTEHSDQCEDKPWYILAI